MTTTTLNTREQILREVAAMVREADACDPEGGRTRAEWAQINSDGWTVDIPGGEPGSDTRHTGIYLTPAELDRVLVLAAEQAEGYDHP